MFDLGMQELVVIFIVALLVFGPRKLPELARTLGKGIGQLKKAMTDIKTEVDKEVRDVDNQVKQDAPGWRGASESEDKREGEPSYVEESDAHRDDVTDGSTGDAEGEQGPASGKAGGPGRTADKGAGPGSK